MISNLTTPSTTDGTITGGTLPNGYTIAQLQVNVYGQWRGNCCITAQLNTDAGGEIFGIGIPSAYQNKPCRIIAYKI